MKPIVVSNLAIILAALSAAPHKIAAQPAPAAAACTPSGDLHFVCGLINVEDFIPVDSGRFLVGGSLKPGSVGLYLIDTTAKTAKAAALSIAAKPDSLYPGCAAPDLAGLATHGLEVVPGRDGTTTVYAINHGGRESVEIFRLTASKGSAEWVGCVIMPPNAAGNSIAALSGGRFVVSKFEDPNDKQSIQHILAGEINGVVYLWTPGKGFSEVPGTHLSGDNGVAVTRDGKWLIVNAWGTSEIYRVPLSGQGERSSVKVDFHCDNLRWAPDGKLFVTGQFLSSPSPSGRHGWATVRLDPATMTVTPVVKEAGLAEFDDATSTVQTGQTLWFGTFRGDRIAYRSVPHS
jgi:hypothetical protein